MTGSTRGGFHFGSVGGSVSFSAGDDMVAGDKTAQTTTTTIRSGFKQEEDKQRFLQQLDELRTTLGDLNAKMAETPGLTQDAKAEIAVEVEPHVNALRIPGFPNKIPAASPGR